MEVIPAIDLMNGVIVRLTKGDSETAKVYREFGDPVQVARKWENEGAKTIHVIDLDAAMDRGDNRDVIKNIVKEVGIPIQLGGGLRTMGTVEEMLGLGVRRVILGTMAFEKTPELHYLLKKYGGERVMVALDYLNNRVMIKGWKKATKFTVDEALNKFLNLGAKTFLLTSISQDGSLAGPDYTLLKTIINRKVRIYAAGGISSLKDLAQLKGVGVKGVVVGKALYENEFTLKEAMRVTS